MAFNRKAINFGFSRSIDFRNPNRYQVTTLAVAHLADLLTLHTPTPHLFAF